MQCFNHLIKICQLNICFIIMLLIVVSLPGVSFADNFDNDVFSAGDAIEINVFPDTSSFLNEIYPIDGNGSIFLPLVGKKKISNMNRQEIKKYLLNTFKEYLKFPHIQVRRLIRISALGGFANPGMFYVDPNYPFWNVLEMAGGTLEEDGLKKMRWDRNKNNLQKNLIPIIESKKSMAALGFKSGDQIWTPTPNKPNKLRELVADLVPVATMGITLYTFYYFTQTGTRVYNR